MKEARDFNRSAKMKIKFTKKKNCSFYNYFEQTVH